MKAADLVNDAGIKDVKQFAIDLLSAYKNETIDINCAVSKVRGVI